MKTLKLDFLIMNKPASVDIDFSEDDEQPVAAIRLSYGNSIAVGMSNVRNCLGESLDSLISHAVTLRDINSQ